GSGRARPRPADPRGGRPPPHPARGAGRARRPPLDGGGAGHRRDVRGPVRPQERRLKMVRLRSAALAAVLTTSLSLARAAAGSARAEDPPPPDAAPPPAAVRDVLFVFEHAPRPSESALAPLYEDIEVMRRLLTRSFVEAYGLPASPTLGVCVSQAGQ